MFLNEQSYPLKPIYGRILSIFIILMTLSNIITQIVAIIKATITLTGSKYPEKILGRNLFKVVAICICER